MRILFTAILLLISGTIFPMDISDDIAAAIRSGNAKQISGFFSDNVDLKIIDKEGVYSKSQAELIVKDFFAKHTVKSFTIGHKSAANNGSLYSIGTLETSNGKYRIYFLLKKGSEKTFIQQFRIETENE